jgi:hypothetical protein
LPSWSTEEVDLRWLMIGTHGLTYQMRMESDVRIAVKILSRLQITCSTLYFNAVCMKYGSR